MTHLCAQENCPATAQVSIHYYTAVEFDS
jgi:hypothetical protein